MGEMSLGTIYDLNKAMYKTFKPYDTIKLGVKCGEIAEWCFGINYIMLLCNDRKDYTVFNLKSYSSEKKKKVSNIIMMSLLSRGKVIDINKIESGYEIWIRDSDTEENFCYYLFDYSFGVEEV